MVYFALLLVKYDDMQARDLAVSKLKERCGH